MNHVFFSREHLLVVYVEGEPHPKPEGMGETALLDLTNWPCDIMPINETQCMVFADPGFMTTFGSGFTLNGELVTGSLVWRDRFLYRYSYEKELDLIGDFPSGWHNLSRDFYVNKLENGELYDELIATANRADNVNETKEYQDQFVARMLRLFVKYNVPAQFGYCINVRNGCMSRVNRARMKELEEKARNAKN
ncbi:hypothetical protein pEaSNUABM37_00039 [Erwinia phage pEa_SNUABM_37]|nr:hypothetical protein pEaSNUABM37_00039 [Erwinia phage pEa_SNUABM_37]QXO10509.1 hypothetical protein pEaSNUABM48_00039 [Erwinia phage pEa_SNUABM_48]